MCESRRDLEASSGSWIRPPRKVYEVEEARPRYQKTATGLARCV